MNSQGFVLLHRKLLENPIIEKPAYLSLWITLLLLANHEEKTFIFNKESHTLTRGQLITGRSKLAKLTGIPASTIEDILKYLENSLQIRQQSNSRFRVITILNYDKYQKPDRKATASRQPADTNNNDNNENKIIRESTKQDLKLSNKIVDEEFLIEMRRKHPSIQVTREWEKCQNYHANKGKKMLDPRAALRNWLLNAEDYARERNGGQEKQVIVLG